MGVFNLSVDSAQITEFSSLDSLLTLDGYLQSKDKEIREGSLEARRTKVGLYGRCIRVNTSFRCAYERVNFFSCLVSVGFDANLVDDRLFAISIQFFLLSSGISSGHGRGMDPSSTLSKQNPRSNWLFVHPIEGNFWSRILASVKDIALRLNCAVIIPTTISLVEGLRSAIMLHCPIWNPRWHSVISYKTCRPKTVQGLTSCDDSLCKPCVDLFKPQRVVRLYACVFPLVD
jgi:hypothetical protein